MNRTILKHEFKMMLHSKKNILFIMALIVIIFGFCFIILPTQITPDSFDSTQAKHNLEDLIIVQEGMKERGATGFRPMSGGAVYAQGEMESNIQSKLITSFDDGDYLRFLRFRLMDSSLYDDIIERNYSAPSQFRGMDINHAYSQTQERYLGYFESELPITYQLIEQKTALQTIQNFLLSSAVLLIIFCAIYFSSDMLTKDRHYPSVLQGLPIAWYRLINLKSLVAFGYSLFIISGLFAIALLIVTLLNGFGSFNIPVVTTEITDEPSYEGGNPHLGFNTIPMGLFLLLTFLFIPALIYLFIRINAIFSLLLKNTWIVLMLSSILLFSEFIYFSRTTRELFGVDISLFPQTYFDIGKIVTGEKLYLLNHLTMSYEKGWIVLIITILIIEIVLFIVSRIVSRRRFYQGA